AHLDAGDDGDAPLLTPRARQRDDTMLDDRTAHAGRDTVVADEREPARRCEDATVRTGGTRESLQLVREPGAHDTTFDLLRGEHVDIELPGRRRERAVRREPAPWPAVADVPGGDPHPSPG